MLQIYIEPLTGSKFYSKPQVMRYLQALEDKNDGGRQQQVISFLSPCILFECDLCFSINCLNEEL